MDRVKAMMERIVASAGPSRIASEHLDSPPQALGDGSDSKASDTATAGLRTFLLDLLPKVASGEVPLATARVICTLAEAINGNTLAEAKLRQAYAGSDDLPGSMAIGDAPQEEPASHG